MKRTVIGLCSALSSLGLFSCGGAHGDDPGHAYMPDMYYSRAYEAYGYNNVGGEYDSLHARGISYNGLLVPGTVARGDMLPTHITAEDTAGAKGLQNPFATTGAGNITMKEAERLYLVNCGICHGPALDGNGPLWKGGDGPYPAAPRPLNGDYAKALTDGSIYHTITFGKGQMGSYASQLRPEQRWMVINFIRSKQGSGTKGNDSTATSVSTGAAAQPTQSAVETNAKKDVGPNQLTTPPTNRK